VWDLMLVIIVRSLQIPGDLVTGSAILVKSGRVGSGQNFKLILTL